MPNRSSICAITATILQKPQNYGARVLSEMIERHTRQMIADRKIESLLQPGRVHGDPELNVVEFGCATGSSSLDPLSKIRKAAGPSFGIKAVMNDLPLNDWKTLHQTLALNVPDVKVEVSSQSMYAGTLFA